MGKMNVDDREEGEITEYEDISSDEEEVLLQRIAEIEAKNQELEKISNLTNTEVTDANESPVPMIEKENATTRAYKDVNGVNQNQGVVVLSEASCNHNNNNTIHNKDAATDKKDPKMVPKPRTRFRGFRNKPKKPKRVQKPSLKCQLILSEDEFDTYDQLPPLVTEQLSPDPLPSDDDEELVLKLRLEALQSKQEIKDDLNVILKDNRAAEEATFKAKQLVAVDEEQELRLIALKSAIVKKHEVRMRKRAENRPYSPTDNISDNMDVPSPPVSLQNMDISPLSSPLPFENSNPIDMDIVSKESNSPIFFGASPIPMDEGQPVTTSTATVTRSSSPMPTESNDNGVEDEEDPDQLRALLLSKITTNAQQVAIPKSNPPTTTTTTTTTVNEVQPIEEKKKKEEEEGVQSSVALTNAREYLNIGERRNSTIDEGPVPPEPADDEGRLRAMCLLSTYRSERKRARSEEPETGNESKDVMTKKKKKPLSELLSEMSKKVMASKMPLEPLRRIIINDLPKANSPASPSSSSVPSPRNSLIVEMPQNKVAPVIINMGETTEDDDEEDEGEAEDEQQQKDEGGEVAAKKENLAFDVKLSEFLKQARDQVQPTPAPVVSVMRTTIKTVKVVSNAPARVLPQTLAVGVKGASDTPVAVKHLPPSTQLEYRRLVNRMRQLERQKQVKATTPKTVERRVESQAVPADGGGVPTVQPVNNVVVEATTTTATKKVARVTLKDRLKALSDDQRKMLLAVQERKLVDKRNHFDEKLDTFLATVRECKEANRMQMVQTLEVQRLRRLLKHREAQLVTQRKLCDVTLPLQLQTHNQAVLVARQGLATTTSQCLEIGRMITTEDGEHFRLPRPANVEEMAVKSKLYREEIRSYKELRTLVRAGTFTAADVAALKAKVSSVPQPQSIVEAVAAAEAAPLVQSDSTPTVIVEKVAEAKEEAVSQCQAEIVPVEPTIQMPVYKSPLESMGHFNSGSASADAIICPFQLNGNCADDECQYKHLPS